ncbi:hypothetical protein GCM10029976_020650 [Kribbella albertanoniae]
MGRSPPASQCERIPSAARPAADGVPDRRPRQQPRFNRNPSPSAPGKAHAITDLATPFSHRAGQPPLAVESAAAAPSHKRTAPDASERRRTGDQWNKICTYCPPRSTKAARGRLDRHGGRQKAARRARRVAEPDGEAAIA